jgi:hypothetical protein
VGKFDLILGAYAAALSTLLALDQFRQRRSRITLVAEWYAPKDEVHVQIVNIGSVAVTLRSVVLAYGPNTSVASIVAQSPESNFRLEAGGAKDWIVKRAEIVEGRVASGARIGRRNYVWLIVELFGRKQQVATVSIDAKAIGAAGRYGPAEANIAADLLVGFRDPEVENQPRDLITGSR